MDLIKQHESGSSYQANGFRVYYRNKSSLTGDNDINKFEHVYLLSGEAEVTVGGETRTETAPAFFELPARTYHSIKATSDICFLIFEPRAEK